MAELRHHGRNISRYSSFKPWGSDKPISEIQISILYIGHRSQNAGCFFPHHAHRWVFFFQSFCDGKTESVKSVECSIIPWCWRGVLLKGGCLVKLAETPPTSLTSLVLRRSHWLCLFVGVAAYRLKPLCQRHTFPPADKHAPNGRSAYFLESLEACQYQALSSATTVETVLQWMSARIVASEKSMYYQVAHDTLRKS